MDKKAIEKKLEKMGDKDKQKRILEDLKKKKTNTFTK